MGRLADRAVGDEPLGQFERRVVAEALADPEDQAGVVGGLGHVAGVVDRVGERLLARDVLAGGQRVEDVVVVEVGRGKDLDRVDVGVGQHGVEVGVRRRRPPGRSRGGGAALDVDRRPATTGTGGST